MNDAYMHASFMHACMRYVMSMRLPFPFLPFPLSFFPYFFPSHPFPFPVFQQSSGGGKCMLPVLRRLGSVLGFSSSFVHYTLRDDVC